MPLPPVRRALLAGCVLAAVTALAGCGSASEPSPPAGVDELVIPTPSPDPADFVARVDNPWLPLEPGSVRTYEVTAPGAAAAERTVRVASGAREVDGVPTTEVVTTQGATRVVDLYAQDRDGNVWWFGRDGEWLAGTDGAEAGVAMLATPRIGDGYRTALLPAAAGTQEPRGPAAEVAALGDFRNVRAGGFDDVVELRETAADGSTRLASYAPGVGLILAFATDAGDTAEPAGERVELVSSD